MSAQDGLPTPRPTRERAAWLLHPASSIGRVTISSAQYEELRAEALALKNEKSKRQRRELLRRATELTNIFLMNVRQRHGLPRQAITSMQDEVPEEYADLHREIVEDTIEAFVALLESRKWRPEEQR